MKGVGTGNLRILLREGEEPGKGPGIWTEAHNIFLQEAAEMGLVGLGLLAWLFWTIARVFLNAPSPWKSSLFAAWGGLLTCGLTESWFNDGEPVMVLLALAASAYLLETERKPGTS